jgi:hypothetical protein
MPDFFKSPSGLLHCQSEAELAPTRGIITEVIAKASEQLFQGKGLVGISLPVRIFEKRSVLEKITDYWITGTKYLTEAGKTSDPKERLKNVICFIISGFHMAGRQKKPFNPILGETLEAIWPDGSKIMIEHISHHPPISCFIIEHPEKLFRYEGTFEYKVKIGDMGNSLKGQQVGPNRVIFKDGTTIGF